MHRDPLNTPAASGTLVPQESSAATPRDHRAGFPAGNGAPRHLPPMLATRFALFHELTTRTGTLCSRALAALEAQRNEVTPAGRDEVRRALAEFRTLRPLRESAMALAAATRRRPAGDFSAPPRAAGRDDPRRAHHGILTDEVILAPIVRGVSYRHAATELSPRFGRTVTKRQVEEAVRRAGGLHTLRRNH